MLKFYISVLLVINVCCATTAADTKIRIAAIFEENIPYKKSSVQEILCMTTAVLEESKAIGFNYELAVYDNKRSAYQTGIIANEIVGKKFDIVVGTNNSAEALPASEILSNAGIPFFVPNATNPEISKNRPYIVRMVAGDTIQARVLAEYSQKSYNPEKIVLIENVSRAYSRSLSKEFIKNIRSLIPGIKLIKLEIIDGFKTYKQLVTDVLTENPDLVFMPLKNPRAGNIYLELAKRKAQINLLGGDGVGTRDEFFKMIGRTTDKIDFRIVKHWNNSLESPEKDNYLATYEKHCSRHQRHTFFTVLGYDTATFLVKSVLNDKSARGMALIRNAKKTPYHGLLGKLRFDESGFTVKPFHIFAIVDNTLKYLETYNKK